MPTKHRFNPETNWTHKKGTRLKVVIRQDEQDSIFQEVIRKMYNNSSLIWGFVAILNLLALVTSSTPSKTFSVLMLGVSGALSWFYFSKGK